ncbi:hypothetical protein TanjilG_22559 [Lupinus angustifolius]|uniref:Uncharacterized protein n=1 Tax=Lupinus angustifolius TaxID=3871 RepID=A0A4P1RSZ0_LUPAN|nr:hypothetical protein TanjilG_22559 [Lupinus angustifolius]
MAMEEHSLTEWRAHCGPYLGDISALCFLHFPSPNHSLPFLLAGLGSEIMVYDLDEGKVMRSFSVFQGIRVHGITSSFLQPSLIAVFGETRVKLFSFSFDTVPHLTLIHLLPKFGHWVLDVCFLKGCLSDSNVDGHFLAIGCSDHSVHIWDISKSITVLKIQSPVRCLLYSMRLWGHNLEDLRIASGTIFNEIIVWKVASHHNKSSRRGEDHYNQSDSFSICFPPKDQLYEAVHICKLIGHEGSIFRIAWSSCGSKLLSVSDDRSARVWDVPIERQDSLCHDPVALVLFGHNARVWDCCISDFIIVWKVASHHNKSSRRGEDHYNQSDSFSICFPPKDQLYEAVHICKLIGHEGSIFRIAWSSCGSKLLSVSDDRSARVWDVPIERQDSLCHDPVALVLFGHNARVWDCCISDFLIVTASEDCTCRVWGVNVHRPRVPMKGLAAAQGSPGETEMFSVSMPNVLEHNGLTDSKSEYVRCLRFSRQDTLYVSTNHGYLYHAKLCSSGGAQWNQLFQVSNRAPIVCMDLLSMDSFELECGVDDWIAIGDGKGNMTVIEVANVNCTPTVRSSITWPAEIERQLLGAYWCKSLGSDPRGTLKLWRLPDPSQYNLQSSMSSNSVSHIAEFISSYGMRIMCLDASMEEEVLACGDVRGNIVLFPLLKNLVLGTYVTQEVKVLPVNHFKGVHGISSVSSVYVTKFGYNQIEICSTGADGCICYLEYDKDMQNLQFTGMKQVKELTLIEHVSVNNNSADSSSSSYAAGFASVDFIVWNLANENKVMKISCGGWRRPHSYYLGDVPEMKNCFAFVKVLEIGRHQNCLVNMLEDDVSDAKGDLNAADEEKDNPTLLISVGAKRVLTSWVLKNRRPETDHQYNSKEVDESSLLGSMTFQWLSTDMPAKYSTTHKYPVSDVDNGVIENVSNNAKPQSPFSERGMMNLVRDKYEDDWRYLAVTAFLVKCASSRISVCFVVVACSDATLMLRALILPFRLWFDVALLVPLLAPVLSLQHIIFPVHKPYKENVRVGNIYIVISGSTDGSVAFWDLTGSVEAFMQRVSVYDVEKFFDCQKRPRTGRGSQGGRLWRSLRSDLRKKKQGSGLVTSKSKSKDKTKSITCATHGSPPTPNDSEDSKMVSSQAMDTASPESEIKTDNSSVEVCEIQPLRHMQNIHQSGVNCLHVSEIKGGHTTDSCHVYSIISGGDDQALNHLIVEFSLKSTNLSSEVMAPDITHLVSEPENEKDINYQIRFLIHENIPSAHSASVKGVWTDGSWVFSTGLDQRVRCWHLRESKLIEHAHLVVSVPEPEALSARACGRNHYQIAVAGRGMQIVDFSES